jgi:O-antigen/teichoic acid export membrane protein
MRTVVRNIAWLTMSQGITWMLSLVLLVFVPRLLGDADVGRNFVATTFVGFFELLANLGTTMHLTRAIARDTSLAGHMVANLVVAKAAWAVFVGLASIALAALLGYDRVLLILVAWCALSMVFSSLYGTVTSGLHGLQRMAGSAVASVVQKVLLTALALIVLESGKGVIWYTALGSFAMFIQFAMAWYIFRPFKVPKFHLDLPMVWQSIRGGLPFLMAAAITMIYGKIDVPLLERLSDSSTVGWYSVAYQWVSMPAFFAGIVMMAVFPSLSALGTEIGSGFATQANKALRLVFLVGAPVATGLGLIARSLFRFVYSGTQFDNAAPVAGILAAHLPLVSLTMILSITVIASNREKAWLLIGIVAVVVNIGVNLVVIPWSVDRFNNGAIGAAVVTVVTEALITAGAVLLRPPGVFDRETVSFVLRCTAASLAMCPAVVLLAHSLFTKIVLGAVVFAIFSLIFRLTTPSKLRTMVAQLRRSMNQAA